MNPTFKQIQNMLLTQHAALAQTLGQTTDTDTAKAVLMEMQEVLHRINLVQNLLFSEASQQLDAMLPAVAKANNDLSTSLKSVDDVSDFLGSAAIFLKCVDQAADFAKMLAIA
jgi:hypothetical protein